MGIFIWIAEEKKHSFYFFYLYHEKEWGLNLPHKSECGEFPWVSSG